MRLFFFNDTATTEIYTLSLHDALPILSQTIAGAGRGRRLARPTHRRRPQRRGWGRGLRRASGRPRWRGGSRSGGRRVRIEAKLLVAQPNHVGPGEDPRTLHALLVHERPVGTRVDQQIALWRLDDLGVPARNVLPRYHHVAPRLAAEHQRRRGDQDRKSTRLNSSHSQISYAVFCLKKKKKKRKISRH